MHRDGAVHSLKLCVPAALGSAASLAETVSLIARTSTGYRALTPLPQIQAGAKNVRLQYSAFKVYPLRSYSGRSDFRQKGTLRI